MAKARKRTAQPSSSLHGTNHLAPRAMRWLVVAGVVVAMVSAGWWLRRGGEKENYTSSGDAADATPLLADERIVFAQYGGSASCRECHEEAFGLWEESNHALAERPVQSNRDRPAFDPPRSFKHGTQSSAARWTNGLATVTSAGLSGQPEAHTVARVIGHDPLLPKKFNIPNACNRCHKDKNTDWALEDCEKWYGAKMNRPTRARAEWIARAQQGDPAAREGLLGLLRREESPYWRAALLGLLSPWATQPEISAGLLRSLEHTNGMVRGAAIRALEPALAAAG